MRACSARSHQDTVWPRSTAPPRPSMAPSPTMPVSRAAAWTSGRQPPPWSSTVPQRPGRDVVVARVPRREQHRARRDVQQHARPQFERRSDERRSDARRPELDARSRRAGVEGGLYPRRVHRTVVGVDGSAAVQLDRRVQRAAGGRHARFDHVTAILRVERQNAARDDDRQHGEPTPQPRHHR